MTMVWPSRKKHVRTCQMIDTEGKNTPFDKRPVQGKVLMTIVDGRTLYRASDAPL